LQRNATQRNAAEVTDEDINEAVNTNIALVMSHRADISRLAEVETNLLKELNNNPTKLYLTQFQGVIVEKEVGLTVAEKASALLSLSSVQSKRIDKQRQAFGITDNEEKGGAFGLDDLSDEQLIARIAMRKKELGVD